MKRPNWPDTIKAIQAAAGRRAPLPASDFWDDFRARARLRHQTEPARRRAFDPSVLWVWIGCACLLALAAGVGLPLVQPSRPGNCVNSLDVVASHTGVVVMEGGGSGGTVLWVVDMDDDADGGAA